MTFVGPYYLKGLEGPGSVKFRSDSGSVVIATIGDSQAVRYNVEDQTILNTWFAPSYFKITAPVTKNGNDRDDEFVTILDHKKLLVWDGRETKLEDVPPAATLRSKAVDVLRIDEECLVVFDNGSAQSVEYLCNNENIDDGAGFLEASEELLKSILVVHKSKLLLAHLIASGRGDGGGGENRQKSVRCSLYQVTIDPEFRAKKYLRHLRTVSIFSNNEEQRLKCVNFLLNEDENDEDFVDSHGLEVVTITSDGILRIIPIIPPGMDTIGSFELPDDEICLKGVVRVAQVGRSHHVGVLGSRASGDGGVLLLINTRFNLLLATKSVKTVTETSLETLDSSLFFKHGQRIVRVLSQNLPESLADVVGRRDEKKPVITTNNDAEVVNSENDIAHLYEVLPSLLIKEDVVGIRKIVNDHFNEIPELFVVAIIELYLNTDMDESEKEEALNEAFMIPITEGLIIQHLKQTEFSTAKLMLAHLHLCLRTEADPEKLGHIIAWTSLVIHAHYLNFHLSRDEEGYKIVNEILETVTALERAENSISSLMPLIKMIRQKTFVNSTNNNNASYCIEIIDL